MKICQLVQLAVIAPINGIFLSIVTCTGYDAFKDRDGYKYVDVCEMRDKVPCNLLNLAYRFASRDQPSS